MSEFDDRKKALRSQLTDAQRAISKLPREEREPYNDPLKRIEGVLAYAALVVQRTDAELISDAAYSELSNPLAAVIASPGAAGPNSGVWSNQILDAAARFPAARDREVEQKLRGVVAGFERFAQERLKSLEDDTAAARSSLETLRDETNTRVEELGQSLTTQRESIDQVAAQQTQAFGEAETSRQSEFLEQLKAANERIEAFMTDAQQQVDERVSEIRRMKEETAQLVGAIGLAATAERYGEEAVTQKRIADRLRLASMGTAVLAVVLAFVVTLQNHPDDATFAGKLAVSILIGAIATYLAKQSGRHRRREEKARDLQLELTAFSPFIEPLSAEQQEEERVIMTRKTFGKIAAEESADEEPGPTPLSHVLRRRQGGNADG